MKSLSLLLVSFMFVFAGYGFSQTIEIKDKYEKGLQAAEKKTRETPHRRTAVNKYYSNRALEGTCNIVEEFVSEGEQSLIMTADKPFDRCRYSSITVGGNRYTRIVPGGWKKETDDKETNFVTQMRERSVGPPKEVHNFRVTPDKLGTETVTLYFHYAVYELSNGLSFIVHYDWVNSNGLIVKKYTRSSFAIPDNLFSETTDTYEYNPKNLKIEAPIK